MDSLKTFCYFASSQKFLPINTLNKTRCTFWSLAVLFPCTVGITEPHTHTNTVHRTLVARALLISECSLDEYMLLLLFYIAAKEYRLLVACCCFFFMLIKFHVTHQLRYSCQFLISKF